jgi:phosphate:Na+ symporter
LADAARETLRMGDRVEVMLRKVMAAMMINDHALVDQVSRMDNTVDRLYEAIKLYVTKLTRGSLDEREGRRAMEVIFFLHQSRAHRQRFERTRDRLREGRPETIETTSLHLDVLRDLRRIHSHICSVAYPLLDAAGELPVRRNAEDDLVALPVPATHSSPR